MIQRVERHIILKSKELSHLCFLSKNLYNQALYIWRQSYIFDKKSLFYKDLNNLLKDKECYRILPIQTSQQILMLLDKNIKSFFQSLKSYKNNPEKFHGRPHLPYYKDKDGQFITIFTNQQVRIKDGKIKFPEKANLPTLRTTQDSVQQVRIVPHLSHHIIEVIYKKEIENYDLNDKLYLSIDLGLNNFATCFNNADFKSFIINGKIIKSINQYYNKMKSQYMSYIGDRGTSNNLDRITLKRNNMIEDYLHKSTRFIIDYCIENHIKNTVVGYNENWKQKINLGKKNNQNFVSIPYYKFLKKLEYKAEECGIRIIKTEESYTSKCDALAGESLGKHNEYSGKRIKRGLFQSSTHKLINADTNGAINILRKVLSQNVIGNSEKIFDRGVVPTPVILSPYNRARV